MRLHTSLSLEAMHTALRQSGARALSFHALKEFGSATHARAFEVRLEGSGGRNNTGAYGAGDFNGATWDEWGAFLGAVYEMSPGTRAGGTVKAPIYANAADFHLATGDRFHFTAGRGHLPENTHSRHRWTYLGTWGDHGTADSECSKCGARIPSRSKVEQHRAA